VDAEVPLTNGADADGEVVWFWRRDAGVKFLGSKLLRSDGGKKARSPGSDGGKKARSPGSAK
jgi:hypothetical protein